MKDEKSDVAKQRKEDGAPRAKGGRMGIRNQGKTEE